MLPPEAASKMAKCETVSLPAAAPKSTSAELAIEVLREMAP
nr:hypothetical protein [Brevundimonas albigilva]